jgi:hypothetical protein
VRALVSEMPRMVFVPKGWIYSPAIGVFAFGDDYHSALLQSSMHEMWASRGAFTWTMEGHPGTRRLSESPG